MLKVSSSWIVLELEKKTMYLENQYKKETHANIPVVEFGLFLSLLAEPCYQ